MKIYPIALIVFIALAPAPGLAALDTTVDESNDLYGKPLRDPYTFDFHGQRRTRCEYRWRDLFVVAVFVRTDVGDNRCASITYEKTAPLLSIGSDKKMQRTSRTF
jgi:hypothetical protein